MPNFVATYRVVFKETDEPGASVAAESLSILMERSEHVEEHDEVALTGLVEFEAESTPHELIAEIKKLRNKLIARRGKDTWDAAKQLDMLAFGLEKKLGESDVGTFYDHGDFMELAEKIWKGENPV